MSDAHERAASAAESLARTMIALHRDLREAARAQAVATLAVEILRIDGLVGDAVSIARAALFEAKGGPR